MKPGEMRSGATRAGPAKKLRWWPLSVFLVLAAAFVLWPLPQAPRSVPYPTVVVLGAAQYNGRPSPAFRRRLDHALALYRAGGVQQIVVTGGRRPGDPYTEGEVGTRYLNGQGVPQSALIAETTSRTTDENLRHAMTYLPPHTPLTLVTDEAHATRALALAKSLGATANVNASPLSERPGGFNSNWRYLLREKLALTAYFVLGLR